MDLYPTTSYLGKKVILDYLKRIPAGDFLEAGQASPFCWMLEKAADTKGCGY